MALVVFVFSTVLMARCRVEGDDGVQRGAIRTSVIRKGSDTEVQSGVDRDSAAVVEPCRRRTGSRRRHDGIARSRRARFAEQAGHRTAHQRSGARPSRSGSNCAVRYGSSRADVPPGASEVWWAIRWRTTSRRRHRADAEFRARQWLIVGRFDAQRTAFDSNLGRLRATAAGVPAHRLFVAARATQQGGRLRRAARRDRRRPAAAAGGTPRTTVLRGSVAPDVRFHPDTGPDAVGDLFARRDDRRGHHDVRVGASRTAEIGTLRAWASCGVRS